MAAQHHMARVWITGGGSGIGRALALLLARRGAQVAISGRTEASLQQTKELAEECADQIHVHPCDVTELTGVQDTVAAIEDDMGALDTAVLNAGAYSGFNAQRFPLEQLRREMRVNYLGVAYCLDALLPRLRQRRAGHLVLVASIAGYRGLPGTASYCASKAAVITLAEGMKFELDELGIKLQIVTPGFVDTPLTEQNDFEMPFLMQPEQAAKRIHAGMQGDGFEITFPRRLSYALKLMRHLPYALYFPLARRSMRF